MRKYIIKFFALDYIVPMFGTKIRFIRSANVIFPLMLANMWYLKIFNETSIFLFTLLSTSLFFGFLYFLFFPLKMKDEKYMDQVQRWIFSSDHYSKPRKFNGKWVVLLNPILIIIFYVVLIL